MHPLILKLGIHRISVKARIIGISRRTEEAVHLLYAFFSGFIGNDKNKITVLGDRLNHHFPGVFCRELMVTAFDVKRGKPDPEPYLMGLQKGGLRAEECIVVENAPLGVRAAKAAGIFTIAVNTGPLPDNALTDEGADLLLPSMQALSDAWEELSARSGA